MESMWEEPSSERVPVGDLLHTKDGGEQLDVLKVYNESKTESWHLP
jgi:hypothetical protein